MYFLKRRIHHQQMYNIKRRITTVLQLFRMLLVIKYIDCLCKLSYVERKVKSETNHHGGQTHYGSHGLTPSHSKETNVSWK